MDSGEPIKIDFSAFSASKDIDPLSADLYYAKDVAYIVLDKRLSISKGLVKVEAGKEERTLVARVVIINNRTGDMISDNIVTVQSPVASEFLINQDEWNVLIYSKSRYVYHNDIRVIVYSRKEEDIKQEWAKFELTTIKT